MKKEFSRPFDEYRNTANRSAFNKLHKFMLEKEAKIRCSYCGYHRGENDGRKYYGEILSWRDEESDFRHPNWKLVSKKKKQWMNETYRMKTRHNRWSGYNYVELKF